MTDTLFTISFIFSPKKILKMDFGVSNCYPKKKNEANFK